MEGSGRVGEPEVHNAGFKRSAVGDKRRFSLVCFLDVDVVVSPPDIKLHEDFRLCQAVDDVEGERQRVTILDCNGVELLVILYETELSILLLDEEDQ